MMFPRIPLPALLAIAAALAGGCVAKSAVPLPQDDDDVSGDDDTADDDTGADDDTVDDDTGDDDTDCGFGEIPADPDGALFGPVSLTSDLQPLLDAGCDCHQVGNPSIHDLSPGKVWAAWIGQSSLFDPGEVLVVAGAPGSSVVFWKLMGCYPLFPFAGVAMPPDAPSPPLDELTLYYNWMLQGGADN
ncbi:MAG: hypothetical protein QGH45_23450 [Myxococcota bacterium]|nr:hypothetical protein [Myxococcota bacterium]